MNNYAENIQDIRIEYERQKEPLYICSYEMPEKDFKVVAEFARVDTMSATNNGKLVSEKVFMPRTQETRGNIQLSLF